MTEISNRDLAAIINGYEPGDIEAAKQELARRQRIGRLAYKSAGATRKR